jgi:hypothetical protein
MAHAHLKNSAMAAIVLGCALGVAQAAGPSPPAIDPSQLRTLLKLKPGEPLPQSGGGRLTPGPSFTAGWLKEVCVQSYFDGFKKPPFTVFAVNQDGTFFFDASNEDLRRSAQEILSTACQHGGLGYYVHIIDSAGTYDEIAIFP